MPQPTSAAAARRAALAAAATLCLASCNRQNTPVPFALDPQLAPVAAAMDGLSQKVEEFGTVTISSPLLSQPNEKYTFDLAADADTYYTEAQNEFQGTAESEDRLANSIGVGVSGTFDVSKFLNLREQQRVYRRDRRTFERNQDIDRARDDAEYRERVLALQMQRDAALRAARDEPDPVKRNQAIAKAHTDYADALKALPARGGESPPVIPSAEEGELQPQPDLAKRPTELATALQALSAFQGLRTDRPARTLANRGAMITAAGDTTTEYILSYLVDPTVAGTFKGKKVLFGVTMVSVNPGWRTRKGYAADIAVLAKYAYDAPRPGRVEAFVQDEGVDPAVRLRVAADYGLPAPTNVPAGAKPLAANAALPADAALPGANDAPLTPLVAAVSPMTETQALDLASSRRRLTEFSLNLAFVLRYLGMGGQASAFEQFVRQQQSDVATATANVAANAYSHAGGMFGFQVGPRLVAVERVRRGKASGAAEVLERQSFPALILFGFERRELMRVTWEGGKLRALEARLALLSAPTWMPILRETSGVRFSERDRVRWSRDLRETLDAMPAEVQRSSAGFMARARAEALRYKAFGGGLVMDLPEELFDESFQAKPLVPPSPGPATQPAREGSGDGRGTIGRQPTGGQR